MSEQVHFGKEKVLPEEKSHLVNDVFRKVAGRYDIMNDLMSLGLHRCLKRILVGWADIQYGDTVLDLAGGTGDIARLISALFSTTSHHAFTDHPFSSASSHYKPGHLLLLDPSYDMMSFGRDKSINSGCVDISYVQGCAESLPLANQSVNVVITAFGFRNFTSKEQALKEILRVLKPDGKLLIMEFSKPENALFREAYNFFQKSWPIMGKFVLGDSQPYQYLVDSIETHPNQESLLDMMQKAGFESVKFTNFLGGAVAIHQSVKAVS